MATGQVLVPSQRQPGSYARKRRHSVSASHHPGFQLPFPHAPKPVSPQLTPSAVTATGVTPRRRVSTAPLSPQSRPVVIGHTSSSRASIQRRLATYGEQGVAASSLATLEASSDGSNHVVMQITLDENSPLRKKQRPSVSGDTSSSDAKPGLWNVRTFPFHRVRPGSESSRRRLGIPSFGWPKPASTALASPTPDTPMEDSEMMMTVQDTQPGDSAETAKADTVLNEETSGRRSPRLLSDAASSYNVAANPREGQLRCRSTSPKPPPSVLRPIPRPITKFSRRKTPSPPPQTAPPPRFSSPLGPERHVLPPRPRFPRSMSSRGANELRFGKDGSRIISLGERGSGPDMYRRVLLRNAHIGTRKREIARLAKLAAQAEQEEEVYVMRLCDTAKGGVLVVAETKPVAVQEDSISTASDEPTGEEEGETGEKMEVDVPECGDIELLPDIPDMDFEDETS
ncbi:hypothetical protein M408DRAFT_7480 [Serendipita vermifera MAFF 305830]|uniref:Uncharacterized protein n=1 Tax=Serendipita vermifera MAFF 305830 TaxID=933852 RepID=A0A0C2WYG7_SERVB|nr:hypothetical protein M408DRAFT_7480 [Serendipita vermifera MAFF 305830]